jgi:hypothetical protein
LTEPSQEEVTPLLGLLVALREELAKKETNPTQAARDDGVAALHPIHPFDLRSSAAHKSGALGSCHLTNIPRNRQHLCRK